MGLIIQRIRIGSYDLGGGTFDVALISSKDGILTVLGHSGDNFLGGKDFDLKIVEEIITPAITEKYNLNDFDRNNKKYEAVFAQLKYAAEIAKIELSQDDRTVIEVDLTIRRGLKRRYLRLDRLHKTAVRGSHQPASKRLLILPRKP